jgi:hypothetical protein
MSCRCVGGSLQARAASSDSEGSALVEDIVLRPRAHPVSCPLRPYWTLFIYPLPGFPSCLYLYIVVVSMRCVCRRIGVALKSRRIYGASETALLSAGLLLRGKMGDRSISSGCIQILIGIIKTIAVWIWSSKGASVHPYASLCKHHGII